MEERDQGPAEEVALENALRKAEAVAAHDREALVLAVDTVVSLDGRLYGKPQSVEDARRTLRQLGGRTHQVVSAVCVHSHGQPRAATATTRVTFRPADERLIAWYLETGEWGGRAGGYAIQGRGAALIEAIEGDYTNVVGLPVATLLDLCPALLEA